MKYIKISWMSLKNKNTILICLVMAAIMLFSGCAERDRINIFDSRTNNQVTDLNFRIEETSFGFSLKWDLSEVSDVDSVFIYRSFTDENSLEKIVSLSGTTRFYSDNNISDKKPVFYALSLYSNGMESARTRTIRRIHGNCSPVILTYYGYAAYYYSFDLAEQKKMIPYVFPHFYMLVKDNLVFATSPSYDEISKGNLFNGSNVLVDTLNGAGPILSVGSYFYVGTTTNYQKQYKLVQYRNDFKRIKEIHPGDTPFYSLQQLASNSVAAIDSGNVYFLDTTMKIIKSFSHNLKQIYKAKSEENRLYILGRSADNENNLYVTSFNQPQLNFLFSISGNTFDVSKDTIWCENGTGGGELVKQLIDGTRLFSIELSADADDISISDKAKVVYVVFRRADKVNLYNNNGTLLSSTKTNAIYDPVKIKIIQ